MKIFYLRNKEYRHYFLKSIMSAWNIVGKDRKKEQET